MASTRMAAAAALLLGVAASGCGAVGAPLPFGGAGESASSSAPSPGAASAPDPDVDTREGEPRPAPGRAGEPPDATGTGVRGRGAGSSAEEAPPEAVAAYADALAAGDPDRMTAGLSYAAEGSAAHDYLVHQASVARARADGGDPAPDAEAEPTADGYELCRVGGPGGEPHCSVHDRFTARDGLVGGLRVDGRDPGPDLLVPAPDERPQAGSAGVTVTLLSAYRSASDKTLVVTVGFETLENADLDLRGAAYVHAGGRQTPVRAVRGPDELDAGTGGRAAFLLPGATPGGTLRVGGCLEECSSLIDLELPVE